MSTSDPSLQLSRPSHRLRLRDRPRLLIGISAAVVVALLVVASGAGVGVYHDQQARLTQARSDRAAAERVVAATVARAQSDGITTAQLASVLSQEASILGGTPIAPHLGWFDNGEIGRLQHQAAQLRGLVGRIDAIQVSATGSARDRVAVVLAQMDAAIAAAQAAGIDTTAEAAFLAGVRDSVTRAGTPPRSMPRWSPSAPASPTSASAPPPSARRTPPPPPSPPARRARRARSPGPTG